VRVTSALWVSAYLRRCQSVGAYGAVVHRGAHEAGAIYIKVSRLDGTALLLTPAPQSLFEDEGRPSGRLWLAYRDGQPVSEQDAERFLRSELRFDPDLWLVEIEDREGRHHLLPGELTAE
jgi:hypothetical protein